MQLVSRMALISWLSLGCAFSMKKEYPGVQDIHLMIDQFHKRYQEEIAKTKQQNEVLNKTLSDAKNQNASLQQQIDQLIKESEEGQQRIEEALNQITKRKDIVIEQKNVFIKKLNEKVEKLKSKNEELTKKLEEIDNLNDEYLKQIGQPGFENRKLPIVDIIDRSKTKDVVIAKQIMQLNGAAQRECAFKAAYAKLKSDYEELSKTCDGYMKQYIFVDQERRKQQEISAMLDRNNKQLAEELEKYKKSDLNEVVGNSNLDKVVELKRQISVMQLALDSESLQNKELEGIIRQQEKDHKAEIAELKKKYDAELAKRDQEHKSAMVKLEKAKQTLISQMRSYKKTNITQDDVDALKAERDKLKVDNESLTEKLDQTKKDFAEKNSLAEEQEQVIHNLRLKNQKLMNKIDELKSQKSTNKWQPKSGKK